MSAITKTFLFAKRFVKFIWFMKTYWIRSLMFNIQTFELYVLDGQSVTVVDMPDRLIPVNNYYTRYEGTARAAK